MAAQDAADADRRGKGGTVMAIIVKPSDLQYKYRKYIDTKAEEKFCGKPDLRQFNRDDLYEVLPMFAAVMDELQTDSGAVLHRIEEMLNLMPGFVRTREDTFDYLVGSMREMLD